MAEVTLCRNLSLLGQHSTQFLCAQGEQCVGQSLTRTAAAEMQRLGLEHAHRLLVIQPIKQLTLLQAEQLLGFQRIRQLYGTLPASSSWFCDSSGRRCNKSPPARLPSARSHK